MVAISSPYIIGTLVILGALSSGRRVYIKVVGKARQMWRLKRVSASSPIGSRT